MSKITSSRCSGGKKVLGNFQCWDVLLIFVVLGQMSTVLSVCVGRDCLDCFLSSIYFLSIFPSLGPDTD